MTKKILIGIILVLALFAGGIIWLVSSTGPENAPSDIITTDVTRDYIQ